ncbi:ATP-dependent helicase [Alkalimonas sp. MEB108]|uniref:DNA 3'-5' helicase n=1 Tax=Alkalimonas cellulosilytica TaxID=3058395 RepID=A0ABU7JAZ1_9GAMM|nr:ATP-dependent helicase [Alkalimonas sp. MEB108]MEE2003035.1 ATP-dependent helicase [Alkalimonas sp. MEB108]
MFTPTDEQKAIFQFRNGFATVFAGPGTGKTTTLLQYVQQANNPGEKKLMLCFNRSVSIELKERLEKTNTPAVDVATFHSLAYKALKFELQEQLDTGTDNTALKNKMMRQALKESHLSSADMRDLGRLIDSVKAQVATEVASNHPLKRAYHAFERLRRQESVLFYEDWLHCYAKQLRQDGAPAYGVVMVDEAQDLNPIQFELFRLLCQHAHTAIMVGDVDQSLYEWREAVPEALLSFEIPHLKRQVFTLSNTFRFGHHQAMVAQALIQKNCIRHSMVTVSQLDTPTPLLLHPTQNTINTVLDKITALQKKYPNARIAVIARLWSHLDPLQWALRFRAIPYNIKKDYKLSNDKAFALVQALSALQSEDWDRLTKQERQQHLSSLLSQPQQPISKQDKQHLARMLANAAKEQLRQVVDGLLAQQGGPAAKVLGHVKLALQLPVETTCGAKTLAAYYRETQLFERIAENSILSEEGSEELITHYQVVLHMCQRMRKPLAILAAKLNEKYDNSTASANHKLVLGSTHYHKGMEYDYVVVLCDEHWGRSATMHESERCNFYVAMTRAKHETAVVLPVSNSIAEHLPVAEASEILKKRHSGTAIQGGMLPALRLYAQKAGWFEQADEAAEPNNNPPQNAQKTVQQPSIKQRLKHKASGSWHQVMSMKQNTVVVFDPQSRLKQRHALNELHQLYEL